MLKTLILKEIKETILSLRFFIAFAICITLIPLSFYIGMKDYETRKNRIKYLEQHYLEQHEKKVNDDLKAHGYRFPSISSVFSKGLEEHLPERVQTNKNGFYHFVKEWGINNPVSIITGKIDFVFVVSFIFTLVALSFTFNSITGEKESGTLKLMLANQIPKWKIILAKVFGPYLVFTICFITGILIGAILFILNKSFDTNGIFVSAFILLIFISLLYLFLIFNLGVFVSIVSRNTFLSMVLCLFIYVIFAMLIPKVSPMVAQIICPVKSVQLVNKEKNQKRQQIMDELNREKRILTNSIMSEYGLAEDNLGIGNEEVYTTVRNEVIPRYEKEVVSLDEKYQDKIISEITHIENEYKNSRRNQENTALALSRISPISSYLFLMTEVTSTGISELNNFDFHAKKFQHHVEEQVYKPLENPRYFIGKGSIWSFGRRNRDIDPKDIEVPVLRDYNYVRINKAVTKSWPDLLLLCIYSIFFFSSSFVSFIKMKVT